MMMMKWLYRAYIGITDIVRISTFISMRLDLTILYINLPLLDSEFSALLSRFADR